MIRVVRLGTARARREGLRLGTVRRPPRGVPKARFASDDWYDLWLPELAPSDALVKRGLRARTSEQWKAFAAAYRREMSAPGNRRLLALLAAMSRTSNFSVGCYCEDASRCHRSVLAALLREQGATLAR